MTTKKTAAKTATNKRTTKQVVTPTNTRVVCPECGAEFDILARHEHTAENVTVLGQDSGMGTIYLPVSKRGDALKKAGIDTSKYFPMQMQNGGQCLMTYDANGRPVPVADDDPIIQAIKNGGTIPNRNLFRRWVMSQVFHCLVYDENYGGGKWLNNHGYSYQWEMLAEELRVQAEKLYGKDTENFRNRNLWFNKELAVAMAENYIDQVREDAMHRKQKKCHKMPYIQFGGKDIFVTDIDKKLIWPLRHVMYAITGADTPAELLSAVRDFRRAMYYDPGMNKYRQCAEWKDAYKGMGAFATMQNLLRFHGCTFPKGNDFYKRGKDAMQMLCDAAYEYRSEGWRLWGLMKQMIEYNGIDIEAKMRQWAAAKCAKAA